MSEIDELSIQIKNLRYKLRMSQEQFANYLGVTAKTIHRWETNKVRPSDLAIATILQVAKDNKVYDLANAISSTNQIYRYQRPSNTYIINIRMSLDKTQEEFAEILSVDIKTIQRWERGRTKPSQFYLKKIAEIRHIYPTRSMRLTKV
jgi:DNA-binding transcriptional regulator YiaG